MGEFQTIEKIIEKYAESLIPRYDGYTDELYFTCKAADYYNINVTINKWFFLRSVTLCVSNSNGVATVVQNVSGKEAKAVINKLMQIKKVYEERLTKLTLSEIL